MFKKLFTNPALLFALLLGVLLGIVLTTVGFYTDLPYVFEYLENQFVNLLISLIVISFVILLFTLFKRRIFKAITGEKNGGLGDISQSVVTLVSYLMKPNEEKKDALSQAEATAKHLGNYLASFLIMSSMLRYIFVLFTALLGSVGTILLLKQNEIMEIQNIQAKADAIKSRLELPKALTKYFDDSSTETRIALTVLDQSLEMDGCSVDIHLTVLSDSSFQTLPSRDYYGNLAFQVGDGKVSDTLCPLLKNYVVSKDLKSSTKYGAFKTLTMMNETDFSNLCETGPSFGRFEWLRFEFIKLERLDLTDVRELPLRISGSVIKQLQTADDNIARKNSLSMNDSVVELTLDEMNTENIEIRDSIVLVKNRLKPNLTGNEFVARFDQMIEDFESLKSRIGPNNVYMVFGNKDGVIPDKLKQRLQFGLKDPDTGYYRGTPPTSQLIFMDEFTVGKERPDPVDEVCRTQQAYSKDLCDKSALYSCVFEVTPKEKIE